VREDLIQYAAARGIPIPVTKKKPYSSDENLWHISHEGGILEELGKEVPEDVYTWTTSPQKAPSKALDISLRFEKGIPVALNGRRLSPVQMVLKLNELGGKHSIGRVDLVENRLVGLKSRGIYECPGATLLYAAHKELESLVLDRETVHHKEMVAARLGQMIYYGQWFTGLRTSLQAFVEATQKYVTGTVKLRLFKGNVIVVSRQSDKSLYSQSWVTFEKDALYNQSDATGFIHLFGLPMKMEALLRKKR